jgi:hypothetical protein
MVAEDPSMISRLSRRFLPSFALVVIALANCPALSGQSSTAAGVPELQVRSADFDSSANTVAVELVNNGQKAITAYGLEVTLTADGKAIGRFSFSSDLLDAVVDGRLQAGSEEAWSGAIQPGDPYTESLPAKQANLATATAPVTAQVVVKGVIWSDGTVEGADRYSMQQILDRREATLRAEEKVLAILDAHTTEAQIQHSVGAALEAVNQLMSAPQGAETLNSAVLNDAVQNLAQIQSSSAPLAQWNAYSKSLADRHQRRTALMRSPQPD